MKNKKLIIIITMSVLVLLATAPWMNKQTIHDNILQQYGKMDGSIDKNGNIFCDYESRWLPFGRWVVSCEGGYFVPFFYFKKVDKDNAQKQQIYENNKVEIETADWKNYRNEKYGFEAKYPIFWGDVIVEDNSVIFSPSDDFFGADIDYKKLLTEKYSLGFSKNKDLEIKITSFSGGKPLRLNCYEGFCGTDNLFDDKAYVEKNYNKENGKLKWLCKEDYFTSAANLFKSCRAYVDTTLFELETGHKLVNRLWLDNYSGDRGGLSFQDVYRQLQGDEKENFDLLIKNLNNLLDNIVPFENERITDWKTYRNEEYGFEFKYPAKLSFSETNGSGKLKFWVGYEKIKNKLQPEGERAEGVGVFIYDNIKNLDTEDFLTHLEENENWKKWSSRLQLNGLAAIKIEGRDSVGIETGTIYDETSIYLKNNVFIYNIYYDRIRGLNELENIYKQIISTFKFTE